MEGTMTMEPRAARTRLALSTALLTLLDDTDLESITVAGLCREAGVHRTTFYAHAKDVVEFATSVFVGKLDETARVDIDAPTEVTPGSVSAAYAGSLREMLELVARDRATYRALFSSPVGSGFRGALTARLRERALIAMSIWASQGVAVSVDNDAAAAYIGGALVGSIEHWAASDDTDAPAYAETVNGLMPPWWPRPGDR